MSTLVDPFDRHALRNLAHSAVLLGGMFALFALFGYALAGVGGVLWLGFVGLVSAGIGARVSPRLVLRMYRARPLHPVEAPGLFALLEEVAGRARLPALPRPYYVPSGMINAFAVGNREEAAIGITDGLLRALSPRELRAVLAHEITHVAHNDAWVMGLADFVTRTVNTLAWLGQMLLLLNLPALLLGARPPFPFGFLLLMIFAPTLSALLQLALSRAREFDADLGAARLTGDPLGLAAALQKMERLQGGFLERIFLPGWRVPEPSLLRTHPPTEERIRRLLQIEAEMQARSLPPPPRERIVDLAGLPRLVTRPPRWHPLTGSWF